MTAHPSICHSCGITYDAFREHSRFCSPYCRLRAHRARQAQVRADLDRITETLS